MKKVLAILITLFTASANAETLLQVFEDAYKNNAKIAINQKQIQLNKYDKYDAVGNFLPRVDIFGQLEKTKSETEISGNPAFAGKVETDSDPLAYGASAEMPVFVGGSNIATYNATTSSVEAKNVLANYEIGGILIDIATSYVDVLQARKQIDFFTKSKNILENNAKMAKLKFKNGSAPKTDLLRAEASFAQSRAQLTEAEGYLNIVTQKYHSQVGKEPAKNLNMPVVKNMHVYSNFDEYYEDVLKFNPSLKSAKLFKESADSAVNASRGQFFPKVYAKASYTRSENNSMIGMNMDNTDSKIGLYASVPLFNRGLTVNAMRKSLTSREIAYLNEKSSNDDVALYAQQAWETYNTAKEVKKAANEKVEALSMAIKGIQLEAKIGRKTSVDVLQTQEEYISAEIELLNAEKFEIISYLQMQQLVGKMTIKDLRDLKYE